MENISFWAIMCAGKEVTHMNNSLGRNNQSQQAFKPTYCTNCGIRIDHQASFCPECGAKLVQRQESDGDSEPAGQMMSRSSVDNHMGFTEIPVNTRTSPKKKKKKLPKWAIIIIVLVVLGLFSNMGNGSSGNDDRVVVTTQQPATPAPTPVPTPTPMPEPTPEPQANAVEMVNNGDYSLVTPEFKQWMDSYEAFYDKYIAFMQKYLSGDDSNYDLGMITDYMSMLSEVEKWNAWEESFDESTLSPADDAYYLLVTMRVATKLMNASLQME